MKKSRCMDELFRDETLRSQSSRTIYIHSRKKSPLSQVAAMQIKSMNRRTKIADSRHSPEIQVTTMDQNPQLFEKMRIIALLTTVIGNRMIVGIPDETLLHSLLYEELTELNA